MSALLEKNGAQLNDEALKAFLYEVEAIINGCLLTVDNLNDPNSLNQLTLNHLFTMKSKLILPPPGMFQSPDLYSRKRLRSIQHLANEFWCCWRKELLLTLQLRQKWNYPRRDLAINDVVIVKNDKMPSNCWQLALV